MTPSPIKSIFEFDNYRDLLRHLYDQSKIRNKNFSYRYFSRVAGFSSPNFLLKVMKGQSKLSEPSIRKFIKGFKLVHDEARFFRHLVLLNQAQSTEERQLHAQAILSLKHYREVQPLKEAQFRFFSKWYYASIREIVNFAEFKEDPEWIAERMVPPISPEQATETLSELMKLGMIKRMGTGALVQDSRNVTTPDEVTSSAIAQFHREIMERASEAIDRVPREERDISTVTFCLAKDSAPKLKALIHKFRLDVLALVAHDENRDAVYSLSMQLIPTALTARRLDAKTK